MSLRCLPSSFGFIRITVLEEISFEEFQDGSLGGHLGYWNGTNAAHRLGSIRVWEQMWFQDFQDGCPGGHLRYRNRMNLAIRNLYSESNSWRPSWISEWNDFSNSESLCSSNASHLVSARSYLQFGRRNFKMAAVAALLNIGTERV